MITWNRSSHPIVSPAYNDIGKAVAFRCALYSICLDAASMPCNRNICSIAGCVSMYFRRESIENVVKIADLKEKSDL